MAGENTHAQHDANARVSGVKERVTDFLDVFVSLSGELSLGKFSAAWKRDTDGDMRRPMGPSPRVNGYLVSASWERSKY